MPRSHSTRRAEALTDAHLPAVGERRPKLRPADTVTMSLEVESSIHRPAAIPIALVLVVDDARGAARQHHAMAQFAYKN